MKWLAWMLIAVCWVGAATNAWAQASHTLAIQDGVVYLDGEVVPADALPPELDLEGVTAQLTYAGEATPVLEIGGFYFTVAEGTLQRVDPDAPGVTVFFRDAPLRRAPATLSAFAPGREPFVRSGRPLDEVQGVDQQVARARQEAEAAVQVAQKMPRLEVERYLAAVQQQNEALYQRLLREAQLEAEVQALAAEIRGLPREEAVQQVQQLRARLQEIFTIKQQNRQVEIEQLNRQLEALQEQLDRREAARDRLVERRLQELTGLSDTADW